MFMAFIVRSLIRRPSYRYGGGGRVPYFPGRHLARIDPACRLSAAWWQLERNQVSFRLYFIVAVLSFAVLAGGNQLYSRALRLSCWAGGYQRNAWMAYCNSERYGVYDVDAIWFGTQPDVANAVAQAQVLTLSDSRLQNALSLGGASDWFAGQHIRAYFLGLPNAESGFGELLWAKFKPHPAVVIFDATPYFTGELGRFENSLIDDAKNRRSQVTELEQFQVFHQGFCRKFAAFCGHNFAYFRSRDDGHWIFPDTGMKLMVGAAGIPNDLNPRPAGILPDELQQHYPQYLKAAEKFITALDMPRRCIVITETPNEDSNRGLAPYLAESLGVTLIQPDLPQMMLFDRAHMTPASSARWTQAFFRDLGAVLDACLAKE
jgi:hypothetical protein